MEAILLVARPGAIPILADRFVAAICGFMLIRPVIACVTAGAVWLECRVLPRY